MDLLPPSNGSAFSGVAQHCTTTLDAWDFAILPRSISAQRCHVRCNGLLGGGTYGGVLLTTLTDHVPHSYSVGSASFDTNADSKASV